VRLLQQLCAVESSFRDKGVIIVGPKYPGSLQCANHKRDRLQLGAGLRNTLLIDSKCLNVEVIREVLETTFIGNLSRKEEESERDSWGIDLSGKD
jgi:hypothetical protein